MAEPQIVQRGAGAGMVRVEGACPACGVRSLFVGEGQYVTCANLNCADPTAPSKALGVTFPRHDSLRCPKCHRPDDHHPHEGCPGRCEEGRRG